MKRKINNKFSCFKMTKNGLVLMLPKPQKIVFTFYFITNEELAHLGHA